MAPNKQFRVLKTTPKKVKRSPAKGSFVRASSGNRVFVQRGNEGLMTAFVTKGSNVKEAAYISPFYDYLNDSESNELDIRMILARKVEGLDEKMTNKGKDGRDYPFRQFVKIVEDDGTGNYIATKDDAKEFGVKLCKALQNTGEYKYPSKFIFSGDLSVETGFVPWTDLLVTEDVNKLVKELYGDSVEDLTFFDDAVTVKEIYGSEWTGKEIKELYFV